jgi:hypothetical protein
VDGKPKSIFDRPNVGTLASAKEGIGCAVSLLFAKIEGFISGDHRRDSNRLKMLCL